MADPDHDRVATDTTNRYFQSSRFTCISCEVDILESEMDNHFTPSHKSKGKCCFCRRPCYPYRTESGKIKVWHRCPKDP